MSVTSVKPCTARSRRCADARSYEAVLRPCCRQHVVTLSKLAADAFAEAGVPFWADYGTLLGAVRNPMTTKADYPWLPQDELPKGPIPPGIIPHDKDADWGLAIEHWQDAWRALRFAARSRRVDLRVKPNRASMKVRLSMFNHTNLDLFFWHTKPDGLMHRKVYLMAVDAFKGRHFHRDMLYPLTTVEWEDMTLPAPRDPEAFLEFRYGPDWRVPVAANNDGVRR
jgi:hypothetical protein